MSSHREAPEISKDPVADNTDTYAFVSPDKPDTVTIITQLHPARGSRRRPELLRVRRRRAVPDQHRQRRRRTARHRSTSSGSRPRSRTRTRSSTTPVRSRRSTAPTSIGPELLGHRGSREPPAAQARRQPDRRRRATSGLGRRRTTQTWRTPRSTTSADGIKVFAGQRLDGFFVDLGAVFDLAALRPFQNLHLIPTPAAPGVNALRARSTCTRSRSRSRSHASPATGPSRATPWAPTPTIGVWASAHRQKALVPGRDGKRRQRRSVHPGVAARQPAVQRGHRPDGPQGRVERRRRRRRQGLRSPSTSRSPSWRSCCPVLYPGVFPNLAGVTRQTGPTCSRSCSPASRAGIIPGFQNFTGRDAGRHAAAQRGDPAGGRTERERDSRRRPGRVPERPAGVRRRRDDRAAGDRGCSRSRWSNPSYVPDGAAKLVSDGSASTLPSYLAAFPYLGHPVSGSEVQPLSVA